MPETLHEIRAAIPDRIEGRLGPIGSIVGNTAFHKANGQRRLSRHLSSSFWFGRWTG
jgi:hypothetical protein